MAITPTKISATTFFFFSNTTNPHSGNSLPFKPHTFTPSTPTTSRLFSLCKLVAPPTHNSVPNISRKFRQLGAVNSNCNEPESTSEAQPDTQFKETIDIQLPRRSLLVQFTCNSCAERTERYINRLAYERGLVYVQCAGCLKYHKLVDNLGLVLEHNLLDEMDITPIE